MKPFGLSKLMRIGLMFIFIKSIIDLLKGCVLTYYLIMNMYNKIFSVLYILLCCPAVLQAGFNFGGNSPAPAGSTSYYEGNQKGGAGVASNQPWNNSGGAGGNVNFNLLTPGLTFTDPTAGGTVTAPGGYTSNASNFTLEQSAGSFVVELDYTNGFVADNSGNWFNADGSISSNGTHLRFTPGLAVPDGAGGFMLGNNADYGWRLTLEAYAADDTTLIDHTSLSNVYGLFNGSTGGGAADDVVTSITTNSIVAEFDPNGGLDGIVAADHLVIDFLEQNQSGILGPGGADYLQVGRVVFTYDFVDRNLTDGITGFQAGTVFGYTLDGGQFVAVPEPSPCLIVLSSGFMMLIRRSRIR